MKTRQTGVILLNAMMMIGLFTLIVVSQLQLISLQFKSINHVLHRHQLFQHLEIQINRQWVSGLKDGWHPDCVIPETGSDVLLRRLKAKEGCTVHDKKQQFNYFVEDLGVFSCVKTLVDGILFGTRHWRLTMIAIAPQAVILQLRLASIAESGDCDQSERIQINTGVTSWRYIY